MPAATKNITLQEGKPSLRVTFTSARSANFASASDFAFSKCPSGLEIDNFHEISASEHATGVPSKTLLLLELFPQPVDRAEVLHAPTSKTLLLLELFPQPMDRAEVLHAPSHDLSGRRKNTPGENDQVLS